METQIPYMDQFTGVITLELENSDHLEPCPFCGSREIELMNTWTPTYWLECFDCDGQMQGKSFNQMGNYSFEAHWLAKHSALDKWNTRNGKRPANLFTAYYARNPQFFDSGSEYGPPLYIVETLPDTHVLLRTIEAKDLDDVFYQMQGENWSPNGEAKELIISLLPEKPHTSMSVNDVVRDPNGDYWECLSAGWRKLE